MGIDLDLFENLYRCENSSYMVVNGVKKSHFAEYRQVKKFRRKFASYQTPKGYTRYYYTDEFEEYEGVHVYLKWLCHDTARQ